MARRVYVERLRLRHLPAVAVAVALRWDVVAFDLDRDVKRRRVWQRLVAADRLRLLPPQPMRGCERAAIAAADRVVDTMTGDRTVRSLVRLHASDEARLLAKRALAEQLSGVAFVHDRLRDEAPAGSVVIPDRLLVSRRLLRRCGVPWLDLPPGLLIVGSEGSGRLREFVTGVVRCTSGAARIALKLSTQLLPGRRRPTRETARLGVAVSIPFLLKFDGPRGYDFLVGGAAHDGDALFLVEFPVSPAFVADQRARGRLMVDTSAAASLRTLRTTDVRGPWIKASLGAVGALVGHAWRHRFLTEAALSAARAHLTWNVLLGRIGVDRYVFTNKEDRQQMSANLLLRAAGVETWNYSLFIGGPYQLDTPKSPLDDRNVLWSFLNSDHWVVNNEAMQESFAAHPNAVRSFEIAGNIFGELIAGNRSPGDRRRLRASLGLPVHRIGRTIAVFDTTFIDTPYAPTTYDDAIALFDDLLRLVTVLDPDDRLLRKPSRGESWDVDPAFPWSSPEKGAVVIDRQRRLAADPHVVWLGDTADTTEVSAVADLTVTHCFSSPTADALAAGAPAVWYESGDRFVDYPLDRVPGAVIRGFEALRARVEAVVPGVDQALPVSDELRRLVDPFLDGGGLTRLREMLLGGDAGDQQCISENAPPANRRNAIGRP